MSEGSRNWAGNHTYVAASIHRPTHLEELRELVARLPSLKALGTRHSFNEIADTSGDQVSLELMAGRVELDVASRWVSIPAAITYGHLCPELDKHRLAVPNLASLPHISVAGACATATHGSGDANRNLAAAVSEIEFVSADGTLVTLTRGHHEEFHGAVVSLGGLGVITRVTLDVVPSFLIAQTVYEDLPFEQLEAHFDEITSDAYSVSFFYDWSGPRVNQVWFKRQVTDETTDSTPSRRFGAVRAETNLHPIKNISPVNCTQQMGVPGPSFDRLPHFRMDFTPSAGEELQTEYLIPRPHALDALRAVQRRQARFAHLLQISEIRTIAADHLWMSPCYGQACVGIHFTWKQDWPAVRQILPEIEAALEPFSARPHWGKLFTMPPERMDGLYERLPAFRRLLQAHDPEGKFRNAFLERYVFG
jgi:xylitol oxidase